MTGFSVLDQAAASTAWLRLMAARPFADRRRAVGLTLDALADLAGVARATVVRLQAGHELKRSTVARIMAALEAAEGSQA